MSVEAQLKQLLQTKPQTKIGLVLFEDKIHLYGDCMLPCQTFDGKILSDFESILSTSEKLSKEYMNSSIKNSFTTIVDKLKKISPKGSTALGPALLFSLGLLNDCLFGSQIIICTDGLANEGLGTIEGSDESKLIDSKTFYYSIGKLAKEKGASISVISLVESECRLDMLSPIADLTGGDILRVDPTKLQKNLENIISDSIIATKVKVAIRIPTYCEFKNVIYGKLSKRNSLLIKKLGNVTNETIFSFEFMLKTPDKLSYHFLIQELPLIRYIPIQARITYRNLDRITYTKIINKQFEITYDFNEIAKFRNSSILGYRFFQYASDLSRQGSYNEAHIYIQNQLRNYSNDLLITNLLSPLNQALEDQTKTTGNKNDTQNQKDKLTQRINQAAKTKKFVDCNDFIIV